MTLISTIACVLLSCATPQDAKIELPDTPIGPLCFSKDGKYLAVMLYEKADVVLVDLQTRKKIRTFSGLKRPPGAGAFATPRLAFSPNSQYLVGRLEVSLEKGGGGSLPVWDVQTGKTLVRLSAFDYQTHSIEFSSDGNNFLAATKDGAEGPGGHPGVRVWHWDPKSRAFPAMATRSLEMPNNYRINGDVLFAPGDKTIVTKLQEEGFEIHDFETGKLLETVKTDVPVDKSSGPAQWATFSPDGSLLAVAAARGGAVGVDGQSNPGVLRIWDYEHKALRHTLPQLYLAMHTSFSPDGKWVAVCSTHPRGEKSLVNIYDVEKGSLQRKIEGSLPEGIHHSASFTPDGQWLAVPGEKDILLWKMRQ